MPGDGLIVAAAVAGTLAAIFYSILRQQAKTIALLTEAVDSMRTERQSHQEQSQQPRGRLAVEVNDYLQQMIDERINHAADRDSTSTANSTPGLHSVRLSSKFAEVDSSVGELSVSSWRRRGSNAASLAYVVWENESSSSLKLC